MSFLAKICSDDLGKLCVRLSVGGLLLFHGIHKLQHGVGPIEQMLESKGLPGALAYGVFLGEIVAPILILFGILTRPAALVVCVNMIVAIALAHTHAIFHIDDKGAWAIELPMLYLLGALALCFMGAGKFSFMHGKGVWN
jgi:putative oxidoreductase